MKSITKESPKSMNFTFTQFEPSLIKAGGEAYLAEMIR